MERNRDVQIQIEKIRSLDEGEQTLTEGLKKLKERRERGKGARGKKRNKGEQRDRHKAL